MDFSLFLPMLPWEGPPLPRFLGLSWPWAGQAATTPGKLQLPQLFASLEAATKPALPPAPKILYTNSEELKVVRGADGGIESVIRHIRVSRDE